MYLTAWIPFWNSLDAVRRIHSVLELGAIVFFLLLALFDAFAHWTKDKDKEHKFGAIGIVFFFIAVTCEFLGYAYGQRNDTLSELVIVSLDAKATHASDKAAEALTDSATAITQAGAANAESGIASDSASNAKMLAAGARKEADSFEADISSAKKESERLKEQLADRTLSDAQQLEIAQKLLPFIGQEYRITAYWDSQESLRIANRIHQSLLAARWKYLPPPQGGAVLLGGLVGVQVWHHPDAEEPTKEAAKALVSLLNAAGILASERLESSVSDPKSNTILINIGSKR
jgi:hypothetical protein